MYTLIITTTDEELITKTKDALKTMPVQNQNDYDVEENSKYSPNSDVIEPSECSIHIGYLIVNATNIIAKVCSEDRFKLSILKGIVDAELKATQNN